jgi:NADPH-dependent curcumin reductase CurA
MLPKHYTRVVLAERPKTNITPTTFRKERVAFELKPGPGEVLVRVDWLSLDPAMRGWLRPAATYVEPVQLGAVMRSFGLGSVVEAGEGCELRPGDIVSGLTGKRLPGALLHLCLFISAADRLDRVCRYEGEGGVSKDHVSATAWLVRVVVA